MKAATPVQIDRFLTAGRPVPVLCPASYGKFQLNPMEFEFHLNPMYMEKNARLCGRI